ncbi:MAG: amino acid permease [Candidatus Eremiobacteraeota bacterium]|nr:amino acid permease [Candidatus Eremiobacteraeota bacterium]
MESRNLLRLFDLTMIVIGLIIGMGIFRTATDSAEAAISPALYYGAWVAGGIIALCGAITYAEIGSRLPVTGCYYKVFAECYHPSVAFAINCIILISNASSLAAIALIGSEYLSQILFPLPPPDFVKALIAMAAIGAFYFVNLAGLRMSAGTQNVLMLIKLAMLLALILAVFKGTGVPHAASSVNTSYSFLDYLRSFGMALAAVSFTYGGYQHSINFGGDVAEPRRNIPRGICIGIVAVIILYLLAQVSYVTVIGFEELKTAKGIAAIVAEKAYGETGRFIFSLLLFLAVLAYVNVQLLSNPRVMFAMSRDGILPAAFSRTSRERGVITVSLTAFTAATIMVLFFANTFEKILGFTVFLDSIGMATSAATIFILRRRARGQDSSGIFIMRLYPLMPLIFIAAYLFIGITIAVNTPMMAVTGIGAFLAFLALYFAVFRGRPHPSLRT